MEPQLDSESPSPCCRLFTCTMHMAIYLSLHSTATAGLPMQLFAVLPRIRPVKNIIDLLQGQPLCFNKEDIYHHHLQSIPKQKDQVD